MLGRAGDQVQLLGVDANPTATSFRTSPPTPSCTGCCAPGTSSPARCPQLRRVWRAYSIGVQITRRQVDHTPALFVIDRARSPRPALRHPAVLRRGRAVRPGPGPRGRDAAARPSARCTPSCPTPTIPGIAPTGEHDAADGVAHDDHARPGRARPTCMLFFATWDQEVTSLGPPAASAQRLPGHRRSPGAARAHGGRRDERRAIRGDAHQLPARPAASARLPGGARPQRPGRRRLRGPGRAVARAHLARRGASSGTGRWPTTAG